MKVLFVSTEAVPFAKVGGMADVVGSLPQALRRLGVDARVIMPGYGFINHQKHNISHLFNFTMPHQEGNADVRVYTTVHDGVPIYFVQSWPYFGNEEAVYTVWDWDSPRFTFFNQLVMATMWQLHARMDWFPDVAHVNDWHSGLLPFLIKAYEQTPIWRDLATVLSIHNLAYQGEHVGGWLWKAGIPGRHHPELNSRGLNDNMMAIAIAYADIVSTVSPRYAIEIQYPYMGYGLDGLIRARVADLYGILNGIDTELWDPATDPMLDSHYSVETFVSDRPANKRALQAHLGLPQRADVPLIGAVSRLVWQKGFDLALPALRRLLIDTDAQFVLLGTGESELEEGMRRLCTDFNWRARCLLQYDAGVAQHIYAGSDLFLMPSHFEPCGMSQMIAMRYGSLPLVRETGGLADTVENYDNQDGERGTGFVFSWQQSEALLGTLRWALDVYHRRPDAWQQMQRNAMLRDFSWDNSARSYIDVYEKAVSQRSKRL